MRIRTLPLLAIAGICCLNAQQSTVPTPTNQPNVFFGEKDKKSKGTTRPLHGVVKDSAGNLVAQAIVEIKHVKTGKKIETITRADGSYRFDELRISEDYELTARHDKSMSAPRKLSIYDSRRDPVINFELEPAASEAKK